MAVFLNEISTSVPDHDIHKKFLNFVPHLLNMEREKALLARLERRGQIEHRYSVFEPHDEENKLDKSGFYKSGACPDTATRMKLYKEHAFPLAQRALDRLDLTGLTHIIVTSCTGFYAPGLDIDIVRHCGLTGSIERTIIGFMGCYAAINALKHSWHIVRSQPEAKILIVNLELCTLHLQPFGRADRLMPYMIFADGCAASIVSSRPTGLELKSFNADILHEASEQITWTVGSSGFDMELSPRAAESIAGFLPALMPDILGELTKESILHWAIHPGGRAILDAVKSAAGLTEDAMNYSREVLRDYGNMSSATIMFVLKSILEKGSAGEGCGMAFGPGLAIESLRFCHAGQGD